VFSLVYLEELVSQEGGVGVDRVWQQACTVQLHRVTLGQWKIVVITG